MVNLTPEQKRNINLIVSSCKKYGITNRHLQAAILATISKESNFIPQSENLNYSIQNINRVWPEMDQDTAESLSHNPERLGNYKYGNKYGNSSADGFKYRGRGFNQITFKSSYKLFGDLLGIDLVSNPDLLNDPKIASDAAVMFFLTELKAGAKAGTFNKFNVADPFSVTDTTTATKILIQINAGRGTNFNNSIVQEGLKKALSVVDSLEKIILGDPVTSGSIIGGLLTIVCLFFLLKK